MSSGQVVADGIAPRSCGYVWSELNQLHNAGYVQNARQRVEPAKHWENPETKRRMHTLLSVSGLLQHTTALQPRAASAAELGRVHDASYVQQVQTLSADESKGHHTVGDLATFSPGVYEIAAMAAGGAMVATDAVLEGLVSNAYVLMRPPGHHAERSHGMGFCVFNNIAVAAAHALEARGLSRVAVVDFDVHHGNGTQHIFEEDDRVLFISIHQDSNYPLHSGAVSERGSGKGEGFTFNVPLPPGSGGGAYEAAMDRVVAPALRSFQPQLILVSCGYDPAFMDPLAAMILGSHHFRSLMAHLLRLADELCGGKLVACHEGGYSELYVPFCGLAVLEEMTGHRTSVEDPYWADVSAWGYQGLQPHQDAVITAAAQGLELLRSKLK